MYSAELNVPQNHVYLFKPHFTDAHNLSRKAVAFGIILTVRSGNASDLIVSRREPPQ